METDVILSINVHEKPDFLRKQLENIRMFMKCRYKVILNCNPYMYKEVFSSDLDALLNPTILIKDRFTGALSHGIYSNMQYALENFRFKYFIVLSSRNLFYQELTLAILENKQKTPVKLSIPDYERWHWPKLIHSELAKHYLSRGKHLISSCHEGLVFHYVVCQNIHRFFEEQPYLRMDTFMFPHCMEEFALQTISIHESSEIYGFFTINRTCETDMYVPTDPEWYVYKTIRI